MAVTVELAGLEVFGRHGAREEEREAGHTFLYDLRLEVGEAGLSDRLEDAVDYEEVAGCVREASETRSYNLLEALAAAVADAVLERFPVEAVSVRVRKRGIRPAGLAIQHSAAVVERRR
jgi:dihydroneopterin aldolase